MMKRLLLLMMGGVCLGLSMQAQTELPAPVFKLDFEGAETVADFGGIQHGDGAIVQSEDKHFGTYYQNMPNATGSSNRTNFLEVTTTAWNDIYETNSTELTIGFWVNPTVANEKSIVNYWGPLFNGYNQAGCAGSTWPCSFEVRYGGQIHGNNNGSWYDNNHDAIMTEVMKWSVQIKATDEAGEELEGSNFEGNWHYFTTVYTQVDQTSMNFKLYVDGQLQIDQNETVSGDGNMWAQMPKLDRFCIGGNSFNWIDPDNAYAYDDVVFYSTALDEDQIQLIIDMKKGNLDVDEQLELVRTQLIQTKNDLENYVYLMDYTVYLSLTDISTWLEENIGDEYGYTTEEEINEAMNKIVAKKQEIVGIVTAYEAASTLLTRYEEYRDNTEYAGKDDFTAAIGTARTAIADPTSTATIAEAMRALEVAKAAYLFSQTGSVIDVTRIINDPWFIDEPYEPIVDGEGNATYPGDADEMRKHLSHEDWIMTTTLPGSTDLQYYFTNGRSTSNLFHSSTVADGVLDLQQTLKNLKPGYYGLSADMSSTSEPTNNHLYATAGSVTQKSPVPTTMNGSWESGDVPGKWVTLTTDKIYVGEDGTLTIGATSTTDGTQYKGWFCVTNFQLTYYGTEIDLTDDLDAKKNAATNAIAQLVLKGDKSEAQTEYEGIVGSTETQDFEKISQLTDFITKVNETAAKEKTFVRVQTLRDLQDKEEDTSAKTIYGHGATTIQAALDSETATVRDFDGLEALYNAYVKYVPSIKAAKTWPAEAVTSQVAAYVTAANGATVKSLTEKQAELLALMKSTIPTMEASETAPKDITGLIVNPSFDGDTRDGWDSTYDGGTTATSQGEVEFYNNNLFNLSQVITALPKGAYQLKASGFYRDGNNYQTIVANYTTKATDGENELNETLYEQHANVKLYVDDHEKAMTSIASANISIAIDDEETPTTYFDYYGNENDLTQFYTLLDAEADPRVYYPYWMWDAYDMITNRGFYDDNKVDFMVWAETQDVTIGAKKVGHIEGDWAILDKFRLFYLGQDVPTGIETVKEAVGPSKAAKNGKFFKDGQIVIVKDGRMYNVAGQAVK